MDSRPALDAVIFSCGEGSLRDCLESVDRQTLPPRTIHLIEDVHPMARAFQQGLEEMVRCGSRCYVSVDADMILHPHCFETLASCLETHSKACHEVIGRLQDGIEGPVWGIRIYQTEVIAGLGGFREVFGTELELNERAERRGWKSLAIQEVLGLHNPVYTPEAAFIRFRNKSDRLKGFYGMSEKTFRLWHNQLKTLVMNYADRRDLSSIAALAGHFCGMLTETDGTIQDYGEATESAAFHKYMEFFAHYADPLRTGGAKLQEATLAHTFFG